MNKVKSFVAIVIATIGLLPNIPVAAETKEDANRMIVTSDLDDNEVKQEKITTTTPPAVVVSKDEEEFLQDTVSDGTEVTTKAAVDFDTEYLNARKTLMLFKATNSTSEQDILDAVRNSVASSIQVKVSNKIKKTDSTSSVIGSITGTLVLSNTNASRELAIVLPIAKVEATETEVKTLSAEFIRLNSENKLNFGTTTVNVKGFNSNGEEVTLDQSKLEYTWYANGVAIGHDKQLEITEDMANKIITCSLNY